LATTPKDVSPHVDPVWFLLDEDSNSTDIILTTWHESLKAKNIIRDPRISISIDDQNPPYSFVL
jgi:general stress protein 26